MRYLRKLGIGILVALTPVARAELAVVAERAPAAVFAGESREIEVKFHNPSATAIGEDLRTQLYQASSATTVALGEPKEWKRLEVLPGQTVLETVSVSFPSVKAETRFLVQWLALSNKVVGMTDVRVFPTNLLAELKPLAGGKPLGVLDPRDLLKPLLKKLDVAFTDLEQTGADHFSGKLAIVMDVREDHPSENLGRDAGDLAEAGVAVVLIQSAPRRSADMEPAVCPLAIGPGAVTVVQARVVANLAVEPQSQLNLVRSAELALHPLHPWLAQ